MTKDYNNEEEKEINWSDQKENHPNGEEERGEPLKEQRRKEAVEVKTEP